MKQRPAVNPNREPARITACWVRCWDDKLEIFIENHKDRKFYKVFKGSVDALSQGVTSHIIEIRPGDFGPRFELDKLEETCK